MSYNITVTADQLSVVDATESTPLVTIRKPAGSGGADVTVDTTLSASSYNPIANAPVATAFASLRTYLQQCRDALADGDTESAIAILDAAILDLSYLG